MEDNANEGEEEEEDQNPGAVVEIEEFDIKPEELENIAVLYD